MAHHQRKGFRAGPDDNGRRLDRILRKLLPEVGLSAIHRALRTGRIRLNGKKAQGSARVAAGDVIEVEESLAEQAAGEPEAGAGADDGPGGREPAGAPRANTPHIVFENAAIVVVNKPRGVATHGEGSVAEMVESYLKPVLPHSLSFRPGPLHRLDKNTTGLLAFSKSIEGAQRFSSLLRSRRIIKCYIALLTGTLTATELWVDTLERDPETRTTRQTSSGRRASTVATPVVSTPRSGPRVGPDASLVTCRIETGITHQIRAQAATHAHPLLGDTKYGGSRFAGGYVLHAAALAIREEDPVLGFERLKAPLPDPVKKRLRVLFGSGFESRLAESVTRCIEAGIEG